MFAGPNGSGKSVLKSYLPPELLGVYLNPDEIEAGIRRKGVLDFKPLGVETTADEVLPFFTTSTFLESEGFAETAKTLRFTAGTFGFYRLECEFVFCLRGDGFLASQVDGAEGLVHFRDSYVTSWQSDVTEEGANGRIPYVSLLRGNR